MKKYAYNNMMMSSDGTTNLIVKRNRKIRDLYHDDDLLFSENFIRNDFESLRPVLKQTDFLPSFVKF